MKFIHAADIKLNISLSGLASYKNVFFDLLRTITRLVDEAYGSLS